jgi:hypothetical protein
MSTGSFLLVVQNDKKRILNDQVALWTKKCPPHLNSAMLDFPAKVRGYFGTFPRNAAQIHQMLDFASFQALKRERMKHKGSASNISGANQT